MTAELFELPNFDVAQPRPFDPAKIIPRGDESEEERFFLALALVFNDLKGLVVFGSLLNCSNHDRSEMSGRAGQWSGMVVQLDRLAAGMIWELIELVRTHRSVVEGSRFQGLLASMPKTSRDCWRLLEELTTGHVKDRNPMAEALCRIRNSGAFHYYQPKSLAKAFRGAFYERSAGAHTEAAYASIGQNLEGTRFHYVDAAAEILLQKQAAGAGVAEYKADFETLLFAVNNALFSLVCRYLAERSNLKPPRPPLPSRGGSKTKRRGRK